MVSPIPISVSFPVSISVPFAITISTLVVEMVRRDARGGGATRGMESHIYRAARASSLVTRAIAAVPFTPVVIFALSDAVATCRRW